MRRHRRFIGRTTLSRQAYQAIRSAILDRRIPPGRKLVVRILAEDLGLSPTPIKEALAALEREGLVEAVPHHGYHIPHITLRDVEELYNLREVVEGLAAARAADRATERLAAQLDRLLERQQAAVQDRDVERYGDLDLSFHHLVREASGSVRLARVAESFNGQIRLLISTSAQLPGRLPSSLQEHITIVRAIKAGDAAAAEAAMRHHVRRAGLALLDHLRVETKTAPRNGAGRQAGGAARARKILTPPASARSIADSPS